MTSEMTGGEAIVRAVIRNGVDKIYGLPGVQMYPLYDALHRLSGDIQTFTTRHEQGAAYMAYGHAQSTGTLGVYTVVPGPGMLNTGAALTTAWGADSPVLCLTGQIPSQYLGKLRGQLHEIPNQLNTMRTLVKWAELIPNPAEAPRLVNEAIHKIWSPRTGPVALEMSWDKMASTEPVELPAALPLPKPQEPDPDDIEKAVGLLKDAKRILIVPGAGAFEAATEVQELARVLGAAVSSMRNGRGIVADDDPNGMNCAAALEIWPDVDVLIGIGSRLEMPYMRWQGGHNRIEKPEAPPHLIRIDADAEEMTRLVPHAGIVADPALGAAALAKAVTKMRKPETDALEFISDAKAIAEKKIQSVQPQLAYLRAIRDVLPRDGFFVEEICQAGFASYYGFPIFEPRTFVTAGFQGTLGFGYPTALGVKAANPDKAVVAISGDGGFMFGMPELSTAVRHKLGVVLVLFNNGVFGNVRRDQIEAFEGRTIGVNLSNPDFVALAESFGVAAERVTSPDALRTAVQKAIDNDVPALIEVPIDPEKESSPWPFLMPGKYL